MSEATETAAIDTPPKTYTVRMTISLAGVLQRAAQCCGRSRDFKHLRFALEELNKHLELVRDDPSRVGEFFELYSKD